MKPTSRLALALLVASTACIDTIPEGLGPASRGDGPAVRFDLARTPWPDVPLPNDVLTFADPTSRTGRRVNLGLTGTTELERRFRVDLGTLEGWGTTAPITVSFDRSARTGAAETAIDLPDVAARMANDDFDPTDDPFYVVDLVTGLPALLDVGSGAYPTSAAAPAETFPNDPKAGSESLTAEDGKTPWYERATDTLYLRPLVPLEEKRSYAVVLTDRLRSSHGEPVRSPFPSLHHPEQRAAIARLETILSDARLGGVYGDLAGTGLARVSFAWSFTTQPTHEDLRLLRAGLHGQGPFARLERDTPPRLRARPLVGPRPYGESQPAGWPDTSLVCRARSTKPYLVSVGDPAIRGALRGFLAKAFALGQGESAALEASLQNVDHLVLGSFQAPYLLGDPAVVDPTFRFALDFEAGKGDVRVDDVDFILAVPKRTATTAQPFPVAIHAHSEGKNAAEALLHAGAYAQQGVATMALALPEHAPQVSAGDVAALSAAFGDACAAPLLGALLDGRARGDIFGSPALGFQAWATHPFHARDVARQAAVEAMQAIRALRSFDGRIADQDYDANGASDVAGDFDADGVPDVGGPGVGYAAVGRSLGGVVSTLVGAVDPAVVAAAPLATGGGLGVDVAFRARVATQTGLLGPVFAAVPAADRKDTTCAPDAQSLRLVVAGTTSDREIEVACLSPSELGPGRTVVVTNLSNGVLRCAQTDARGSFGIPIPTNRGDRLDVQVYEAADAVDSLATCNARRDAPVGRRVQTFEIASDTLTAGTELRAPQAGLGLRRQSPELRRYRDLVQSAVDAGDAAAFAPYFTVRRLLDEHGKLAAPRALLAAVTAGDEIVPAAAGVSLARAAGAVPFLPPRALATMPAYADYVTPLALFETLGGRTPERVLVETHVVEGLARLGQTTAGPACASNARTDLVCAAAVTPSPTSCKNALFDVDAVSGGFPWDAPRPPVPLRLARVAGADVHAPGGIEATWEPRLRGTPSAADGAGWDAHAPLLALHVAYVDPLGGHGWSTGDVCRAWDFATYEDGLVGRFVATRGTDLAYVVHPASHACLERASCAFFP